MIPNLELELLLIPLFYFMTKFLPFPSLPFLLGSSSHELVDFSKVATCSWHQSLNRNCLLESRIVALLFTRIFAIDEVFSARLIWLCSCLLTCIFCFTMLAQPSWSFFNKPATFSIKVRHVPSVVFKRCKRWRRMVRSKKIFKRERSERKYGGRYSFSRLPKRK